MNHLRDYLNESYGQQYEHKNNVREKLDELLSKGHAIFENRPFYMNQFNHLMKLMLENERQRDFGALDFQFETISQVTQGIANKANEVMQEIWEYSRNLDLPSERAAYVNWYNDLTPEYIPVNEYGGDYQHKDKSPEQAALERLEQKEKRNMLSPQEKKSLELLRAQLAKTS